MGTSKFNAGGHPAMDSHPIQGGVEILLVASCYRNRDKLRPNGPLGAYADLTFYLYNKKNPIESKHCQTSSSYRIFYPMQLRPQKER